MKMNRRNALLGLGAIATGGGALFGSGAFSSVEADRSVSLTSTGDGSANLEINVTNGNVATTASDGEVEISASGFNVDATTVYEAVITIINNGNNAVNVATNSVSTSNFDSIILRAYSGQNDNLGSDYDLDTTAIDLASGGDVVVGLVAVAKDGQKGTDNDTITLEARDDENWNTATATGTSTNQET